MVHHAWMNCFPFMAGVIVGIALMHMYQAESAWWDRHIRLQMVSKHASAGSTADCLSDSTPPRPSAVPNSELSLSASSTTPRPSAVPNSELSLSTSSTPAASRGNKPMASDKKCKSIYQHFVNIVNMVRPATLGFHTLLQTFHFPQRWRSSLEELQRTKRMHIVALGGSMTGGGLCKEGALEKMTCAWPSRVQRLMKREWPNANIEMHNLALGGVSTEVALARGFYQLRTLSKVPDIILFDFSVNDHDMESSGKSGRASLAWNLTMNGKPYELGLGLGHSVWNFILKQFPQVVPVLILSHRPRHLNSPMLDGMLHAAVQREVPFIDARVTCRSFECLQLWQPTGDFGGVAHPNFHAHKFLGYVVFVALLSAFQPACQNSETADPRIMDRFRTCAEPLTSWSARDVSIAGHNDTTAGRNGTEISLRTKPPGGWLLYADRKDKEGWISEVNGATLEFPVFFGKTPTLTVEYFRSYIGMGRAKMTVNGKSFILDGGWKTRISVSCMFHLHTHANVKQTGIGYEGKYDVVGFSVPPDSNQTIKFNLLSGGGTKFKILSLYSC